MHRPHVTVLSGLKSSECLCERPISNSQSGYFSKVSFLNRPTFVLCETENHRVCNTVLNCRNC